MSFFPDATTFIAIGNLSIKWYAILIVIGAGITYLLIQKDFKKNGYSQKTVDNLFIGCLLIGIIGARIWYCAFSEPSYYFSNIMHLLDIRGGGLAIQGGLIFGAIYGFIYTKVHRMSFLRTTDVILPSVLIAQAIGRWGNFINKEAFGRVVSESYFKYYPSFIKNGMYIGGEYYQPTFLWESCLNILGFVLIRYVYKKYGKGKRGDLTALYLMWYGISRFVVEGYRTDSLMFLGLKMSQVTSIIFIIVGIIVFTLARTIKYKKPVLLFDLDGTLLDTEPAIMETYRYLFSKYRTVEDFDREKQLEVLGPPLEVMFKKYFPEIDPQKLLSEYREHNFKIHPEFVKPMDNAERIIRKFKEEGYKTGIVSTKMVAGVKKGLDLFDLTKDFDIIIGHDSVEKGKPNPEGIIKACEQLKVSQDNCIYIGDSHTDIEAALNAGVYAIGYVFNEERKQKLIDAKPNRVITDLIELEEIVKENHPWTFNMM